MPYMEVYSMDSTSKRELATAIVRVHRCREAGYVNGRYTVSYDEAARRTCMDSDLHPLIIAMLQSGYADFLEWAMVQTGQRSVLIEVDAIPM